MELGATVCLPKNPNCSNCPLSSHCLAFKEVKEHKEGSKNRLMNVKAENTSMDIEDLISGLLSSKLNRVLIRGKMSYLPNNA